jgi:hypothetical protein
MSDFQKYPFGESTDEKNNPNDGVRRRMKKCPYCAEEIQYEAIVCRYCGRDLINKPITVNKKSPVGGVLAGLLMILLSIGLIAFPFLVDAQGMGGIVMAQNFILCWAPGGILLIIGIIMLAKSL